MRRKSTSAVARGKSMTTAAGDAIGGAAIAATRLVIRKASAAIRSADRALYGGKPKRKRRVVAAKARPGSVKRRTRRVTSRTGSKVVRAAATRARTRSRAATRKTRRRAARPRQRG
jgi:hypothetical protein